MTDILERQKLLDNPLVMDLIKINCEKERLQTLAEVRGWLVDEDLSEHENDRQCPECSAMWHYDHAKSRNTVRAELRAKLEEMGGKK